MNKKEEIFRLIVIFYFETELIQDLQRYFP